MRHRDDRYPLQPLSETELLWQADGSLRLPAVLTDDLLLQVRYRATGRQPCIEICPQDGEPLRQFFEAQSSGLRFLNLSGVVRPGTSVRLRALDCQLEPTMTLLQFAPLPLAEGPLLIVAPHADDAELAAYGLYRHHASQCWIVTVSAGEQLQSLQRQYVPGLDRSLTQAAERKGLIRAWNSATTPWLAGVPPERLVMLGYSNMTLQAMMAEPETPIPAPSGMQAAPSRFRCFNRLALPSDGVAQNRGADLIADLATLITHIRPSTLMVTHPELDPHPDHRATTQAVAAALARVEHRPSQVLLYANHLQGVKGFPFGPEHAGTTLPPAQMSHSILGPWRVHSEFLTPAVQQEKLVALDTMHDLRHQLRLERRIKRWWGQLWRRWPYRYYGAHPYFQTAIKAHEVFAVVSAEALCEGMGYGSSVSGAAAEDVVGTQAG